MNSPLLSWLWRLRVCLFGPFVHYIPTLPLAVSVTWNPLFFLGILSNLAKIWLTAFFIGFLLSYFQLSLLKLFFLQNLWLLLKHLCRRLRGTGNLVYLSASTWPCCFKHPQVKTNLYFASWAHITSVFYIHSLVWLKWKSCSLQNLHVQLTFSPAFLSKQVIF